MSCMYWWCGCRGKQIRVTYAEDLEAAYEKEALSGLRERLVRAASQDEVAKIKGSEIYVLLNALGRADS